MSDSKEHVPASPRGERTAPPRTRPLLQATLLPMPGGRNGAGWGDVRGGTQTVRSWECSSGSGEFWGPRGLPAPSSPTAPRRGGAATLRLIKQWTSAGHLPMALSILPRTWLLGMARPLS